MPLLVVLAGPIAAGKSTIAGLLGGAMAAPGAAAAVVDLDDVAFMQRSPPDVHEFWRRAASVTGAIVNAWFDSGTEVVVVHGPFFESGGYALLLGGLPPEVDVRHVLLRVPVDVALERAAADPSRGMSRDPDFLRSTHEHFTRIEPSLPVPDFTYDTAARPAADVVAELAVELRAVVRPRDP